jgi:alpha-L-fucosidase
MEVDLGSSQSIGIVELGENIARGQAVARYRVEAAPLGEWLPVAKGTTIGYKRLIRLASPVTARRVRVVIEDAVAKPERIVLGLYP